MSRTNRVLDMGLVGAFKVVLSIPVLSVDKSLTFPCPRAAGKLSPYNECVAARRSPAEEVCHVRMPAAGGRRPSWSRVTRFPRTR